jgi:hypothetical protein
MKRHAFHRRWIKLSVLFLISLLLQNLLILVSPTRLLAQSPNTSPCGNLTAGLNLDEQNYARAAWAYFVKNYQPATGFANAVSGYPSGSLWDMGNYLMALNAAQGLNLIDQPTFDSRLNQFLTGVTNLSLFEDTLPNKVYNAANGQIVDYGNNPIDRGIGWSALDIGRLLAAFDVIRTCHPQYSDWLNGITSKWRIDRSVQDQQLYGAMVLPDNSTLDVQEGRLGYEQYAARGYQRWGFDVAKAIDLQPMQFVDIYGVQVPVDVRDFQTSGANNYVVSESYILDGIEFGLQGDLADYAARVLEAQKRRYEATGILTAVSEDNIDQAPYFIYNTVYANGVPWAAITEKNELYPQFRSLSTKAAFGWHYLYPTNEYAQQIFDQIKNLYSADEGYYAGIYEESGQPNQTLTGNTNGLILEILYYKARGNRSLIQAASSATITVDSDTIAPINTPSSSLCPATRNLTDLERRAAQAAWQYFPSNLQATGLVNDRSDMVGTTPWGMGDYLAALHAARSLDIITAEEFDQSTRHLLAALSQLPLVAGELPNRAYNTLSLQPVDYGSNPIVAGTGWSALDTGRLLSSLYTLKTCHPEYTDVVDRLPLDWSYLRVVRDGQLFSAQVEQANGRSIVRVSPETQLGYEEYAARGFQLWGFDVNRSAVGGTYETVTVEGVEIPVQRSQPAATGALRSNSPTANRYTTSDPFLLYGLEFGLDPQMRSIVQPMLQAETARHQRTGTLSASGTTLVNDNPYVVHNAIVGNNQPWIALGDDGEPTDQRFVSTAVAFAYHALFPEDVYARQLFQAVAELSDPTLGYYEGMEEQTRQPTSSFSSSTNSLILQSLLYAATNQHPIVRPDGAMDSPWWQAIALGNSGQGLPLTLTPQVRLVTDQSQPYWDSIAAITSSISLTPSPAGSPSRNPSSSVAVTGLAPSPTVPNSDTAVNSTAPTVTALAELTESDRIAATRAWTYFERNWNQQTGLVNAVDQMSWTTLWDQGSAILGIHAARQLGLVSIDLFEQRMTQLLHTLETLAIPSTGLPNKAYSTATAEMRQLDNTPDPDGSSGWSVLDTARFLVSLHVLRTHYPEYGDRIAHLIDRWDLSRLVHQGWLQGGIPGELGQFQYVQEGRLGYEQYAANGLKLWNITADNALHHPPTTTIQVDGINLQSDRRNFQNSGAGNYLTNDPYLLWGLELGWTDDVKPQVDSLLQVQAKRFDRTGILTAVNEDSLDRSPYFLYYSVYSDGQPWNAVTVRGQSHPELRFLSTKAAFAWGALKPDDAYAQTLREAVQNLADPRRGYLSGRYEDTRLGSNRSIDVNTNAVILESLLYKARGDRPLAF